MTAKEAKIKAVWNSIPPIIRTKIEEKTGWGQLIAHFYKSSTSEAFKDVDATIVKLQLLGYNVEYGEVNIEDDPNACGITTDTKLTIKW